MDVFTASVDYVTGADRSARVHGYFKGGGAGVGEGGYGGDVGVEGDVGFEGSVVEFFGAGEGLKVRGVFGAGGVLGLGVGLGAVLVGGYLVEVVGAERVAVEGGRDEPSEGRPGEERGTNAGGTLKDFYVQVRTCGQEGAGDSEARR